MEFHFRKNIFCTVLVGLSAIGYASVQAQDITINSEG